MKKLTTLFIVLFISISGLFAAPKIPKTTETWPPLEYFGNENVLAYVNNSCQNVYTIWAVLEPEKKRYTFNFNNYSYVTEIEIAISLNFQSEEKLDTFLKKIDTTDLENAFNKLRKELEIAGEGPLTIMNTDIKPKKIWYRGDVYSAVVN